jgi:hypothetical protein
MRIFGRVLPDFGATLYLGHWELAASTDWGLELERSRVFRLGFLTAVRP